MNESQSNHNLASFHRLKIVKKVILTKNSYLLELEIPKNLQNHFVFEAGQYLTFRIEIQNKEVLRDFSIASAPFENRLTFVIKRSSNTGSAFIIFNNFNVGDEIEVSEPKGRFTLQSKPHEFRTILGFASGIGITPIISHLKNILHNEPRTRFFLFYGNQTALDTVLKDELDDLQKTYEDRLQVHNFYSQEIIGNAFYEGRIDERKIQLIINQVLNYDDTDEESTIWDAVDQVLICGPGDMIKNVANACHDHGIPKKNIHFELFESYNDDIYPVNKDYPSIENIKVEFKLNYHNYTTTIPYNRSDILQYLLDQNLPVPYSCKSGICGSCICKLLVGKVDLLENEYLTESEEQEGKILTCMAIPLSPIIKLDFDQC